jgi:hypothetical protein
MSKHLRIAATLLFATGGAFVASEAPAFAYAGCERYANAPTFSGSEINGGVRVDCTRLVDRADLYGRIKEDRTGLPDVVHDEESRKFENDLSYTVQTTTCQDDDHIYTEAQINNERPTQSSRREMNC